MNRPEIALELGIENVHLTMQQLTEQGRPSFIKRAGVSVHSAEEAETAQNEPLENGGTGVCLMSEFMKCENPYERVRIYK